jgi:hypothetical protein
MISFSKSGTSPTQARQSLDVGRVVVSSPAVQEVQHPWMSQVAPCTLTGADLKGPGPEKEVLSLPGRPLRRLPLRALWPSRGPREGRQD